MYMVHTLWFLSQAVVVSDVVVLYVLKKRHFYKENKYQQVIDPEVDGDYEIVDNPPEADDETNKHDLPHSVSCKLQ